jgi:D-lactate dehydrogenase
VIQDDVISRLISLPNVLITSHQAFFTREAMSEIAETTMKNIADFAAERDSENILSPRKVLVTAKR